MFKRLLASAWRGAPSSLRRLSVRFTNTRFTITVAGIVFNQKGEVLLLKHLFRPGSGWGIPGGFLEADEQPDDALRRELREEIRLEVDELRIFTVRSFRTARQVEIVFLGQTMQEARPHGAEVERAAWFSIASLPTGLPVEQKRLIEKATGRMEQNA